MSLIRFKPLGPEGIERRIQEIRAKTEGVLGKPGIGFAAPASISGPIADSGFKPLSAFGPGMTVAPSRPELQSLIENAAAEQGVDPLLFDALVATESAYDPNARSRAGAMGLSQLMPGTAKELGVANPFDPRENLMGGAKYLKQMLDKFGDVGLALAAYNAGPGAVAKHNGIPPYPETRNYVNRIVHLYQARKAG